MAANVSPPGKYPGVYVKTIIDSQPPTGGVATSVGAFIGRAARGPVNTPVTIYSFADYQRTFGGLDHDSAISYQANGFFTNGGAQAEIVRLYRLPAVTINAMITDNPIVEGTYELLIEPLVAGPTVTVAVNTTAGQDVATVYETLLDELTTEPALAGMITNASVAGSGQNQYLTFEISYPSTIRGDSWAMTADGTAPAATSPSEVSTGSGSARIRFLGSTVFVMQGGTASKQAQVQLTPAGGAPFSVSYTMQTGDDGSKVALGLYKALKQDSRANQLVAPQKPSDANLTVNYLSAVSLAVVIPGAATAITRTDNQIPNFYLDAANPGPWGNSLIVSIDQDGLTDEVAQQYGQKQKSDIFNMTVVFDDGSSATSERFVAVTLVASAGANRLDRVLANQSNLVRLTSTALIGSPAPINASGAAYGFVSSANSGADQGKASELLQVSDYTGDPAAKTGLYAFNQNPYGFNILCIPPDNFNDPTHPDGDTTNAAVYQAAAQICVDNNAMLIIDPPEAWYTDYKNGNIDQLSLTDLGNYTDAQARACAVYFPRIVIADPLRNGLPRTIVPCGYLAAVWASVDTAVGVWKAPAGLDAPIGGILSLQAKLNDTQNGVINPKGINALRFFTGGPGNVVWGARTLRGPDQLADQYKYIPVQRTLDYIETSLLMNTRWAVFQPNGAALWAKLQDQITTFMSGLFTQGAFAGTSAKDAYFVQCDATTTTPADQAAGIVNVSVGFAPLYPAEFVVITITQMTASSS